MYNDIEEFICEFKNKKDQYISKFDIIKTLVNILHSTCSTGRVWITRTTFHGVCFEQFQLILIGKKIIDLAQEETEREELW
jgi:hypothetical protein